MMTHKAVLHASPSDLSREILIQLFQQDNLTLEKLAHAVEVGLDELSSAADFLVEQGFIELSGPGKAKDGRWASLRAGKNCIIGLDLGGTKLYGAIVDLTGRIEYEQEIKVDGKTGEACLEVLVGQIEHFLNEAQGRGLKVKGIGVDVPGSVKLELGRVVNAPAVGMHDFPLKERLARRFKMPVFVDNDLKQASLGEAWFGAGKNRRNVVLLAVGTGIAAGMLVDGRPLRGAHERLGELGWMAPGREFLGRKYHGFGALETEASGPGIENRARELLRGIQDEAYLTELNTEMVFDAARKGEPWAEQCIRETVEYLAVLVANIMAFYDPDLIILSGGVSRSSDLLIPPILKLVEGCVLTQPEIVLSSLGYQAGALGALINLVQNCPEFL